MDFVILEKADDVGGSITPTGRACDIPSLHLAPSRSGQGGLETPVFLLGRNVGYLKVTDKYVTAATSGYSLVDRGYWDDDEVPANVFTADGREYVAQFLISGPVRCTSRPSQIAGRDEFAGPAFHSAQWDLTGKRAASSGPVPARSRSCPRSSARSPNFSSISAPRRGWSLAQRRAAGVAAGVAGRPGLRALCASASTGPRRRYYRPNGPTR